MPRLRFLIIDAAPAHGSRQPSGREDAELGSQEGDSEAQPKERKQSEAVQFETAEEVDPEAARRNALAERMAKLGGRNAFSGMPLMGRKPSVKKPSNEGKEEEERTKEEQKNNKGVFSSLTKFKIRSFSIKKSFSSMIDRKFSKQADKTASAVASPTNTHSQARSHSYSHPHSRSQPVLNSHSRHHLSKRSLGCSSSSSSLTDFDFITHPSRSICSSPSPSPSITDATSNTSESQSSPPPRSAPSIPKGAVPMFGIPNPVGSPIRSLSQSDQSHPMEEPSTLVRKLSASEEVVAPAPVARPPPAFKKLSESWDSSTPEETSSRKGTLESDTEGDISPPLPPGRPTRPPPLVQQVAEPEAEEEEEEEEEVQAPPLPPGRPSRPPPSTASPPLPPAQHSSSFSAVTTSPMASSSTGPLDAPPPRTSFTLDPSREDYREHRRRESSFEVVRGPGGSSTGPIKAREVDLALDERWWRKRPFALPSSLISNEWKSETRGSTSLDRGKTISEHEIRLTFNDFSATIIHLSFSDSDASEAETSIHQKVIPPPPQPSRSILLGFSQSVGSQVWAKARNFAEVAHPNGNSKQQVDSIIETIPGAVQRISDSFGYTVFSATKLTESQKHTDFNEFEEIRPGDVVSFKECKFKSGRIGGHSTKLGIGEVDYRVVADWDGKKKKVRVFEWIGGKTEVGSYKLDDLKSGKVIVERVIEKSWLGIMN
jgi:hypothetical protein